MFTNGEKIGYHWEKHAKPLGKSVEQYAADASQFWATHSGDMSKWRKVSTEVGEAYKYKDAVTKQGGIFTADGRIVTFFYD
jgi:hypothetical protein